MLKYFVLIISLFTSFCLTAQTDEVAIAPPFFNQFQNLSQSVNPAYGNFEDKNRIDLGAQVHPNAFSNFRNGLVSSNFRISSKNDREQFIGLIIKNESEGKLLNRNYYYAQYAITIPVNDVYRLQAGTQLGVASIVFQSTSITPGSGAYTLDGNFGLALASDAFTIALGINQINNSTISNPNQLSLLNTNISFIIDKSIKLNEDWTSRMISIYQTDIYNTFALNTEWLYNEAVGFSISWNNRKGLGLGAILKEYAIGKSTLRLGINSYNAVGLQNTISIDEMEFTGGLSF